MYFLNINLARPPVALITTKKICSNQQKMTSYVKFIVPGIIIVIVIIIVLGNRTENQ